MRNKLSTIVCKMFVPGHHTIATSPGACTRSCSFCQLNVLPSRHALQCAICTRWQHRVCHRGNKSGVTYEDYIDLVENKNIFTWHCVNCPQPGPQTWTTDTLVDSDNTVSSCNDTSGSDAMFIHENTVNNCNDTTCSYTQVDHDNTSVIFNDTTCTDQSQGDASIDMTALLQEYGDTICLETSRASNTDTHGTVLLDNLTEQNSIPYVESDMSKDSSVVANFLKEFGKAEDKDMTQPSEQQPSLCTPFEMHKHYMFDELDQSEDRENTLMKTIDVEYALTFGDTNMTDNHPQVEVETTLHQEEASTIIFPLDSSPLCQATPPVSAYYLDESTSLMSDVGIENLDNTADRVSSRKAVIKQSTPIASNMTYRRHARSFLRRISAITSLPGRDFSCTSVDLTPNCLSTRSKTYKRRLSTEDEYPASKKRNIESP